MQTEKAMLLSIITINYNNAAGLAKTLQSVLAQTFVEFEHIIVDGASTDDSVQQIRHYEQQAVAKGILVRWVSEPDKGIYNAMNKGIRMTTGEYIQILNSGDILAGSYVTAHMLQALRNAQMPPILYGNMIKQDAQCRVIGKSKEVPYSLLNYFVSTMNHDCCYIRKDLFLKYGYYDEQLRIVSDWKWFLLAIGLGDVRPVYTDIDVTVFDASGISESNLSLRQEERARVLKEVLPPAVWNDYNEFAFSMQQVKRLKQHHLYGLMWFVERVLFKLEKWGILR